MSLIRTDIKLFRGGYFDYTKPFEADITLEQIAKGLSNECRFGGQCEFYSVAEHSVMTANMAFHLGASPAEVLGVLMHDAHEAVCKDIMSPLKRLIGDTYKRITVEVQRAMMQKVAPEALYNEALEKRCDLAALAVEQRDVMECRDTWGALVGTYGDPLISEFRIEEPLAPKQARALFLTTFATVTTMIRRECA